MLLIEIMLQSDFRKEWPYVSDSPYVRESKTVLDSGFHVVDSGFQVIPDFLSLELSFRIQTLVGFRIPDSGFLELYSGFQSLGFRIPQLDRLKRSRTKSLVAYFLKWHTHIHGSITVYTSKTCFLFCFVFLSFLDASGCVDFTLIALHSISEVLLQPESTHKIDTRGMVPKRDRVHRRPDRKSTQSSKHSDVKINWILVSLKFGWISSEESRLCHFSLILFILQRTKRKTDSLAWQQYWRHTFEDDSIRMATHCS